MTSVSPRRSASGEIIYRHHANGWAIWRRRVEDDRRGWTPRGAAWASGVGPKVYWEVKRSHSNARWRKTFDTLREAVAWCDDHRGI